MMVMSLVRVWAGIRHKQNTVWIKKNKNKISMLSRHYTQNHDFQPFFWFLLISVGIFVLPFKSIFSLYLLSGLWRWILLNSFSKMYKWISFEEKSVVHCHYDRKHGAESHYTEDDVLQSQLEIQKYYSTISLTNMITTPSLSLLMMIQMKMSVCTRHPTLRCGS